MKTAAALLAVALAGSAYRLAAAVDAPEAVFGSGSEEAGWKPSTTLPPGAEYRLLREDPVTHGVQALARFPSGYAVPSHAHEHDETLILVTGKLEVRVQGRERVLGPGDFVLLPAGVPHELKARGWGGVRLVITTGGPYSVKKSD